MSKVRRALVVPELPLVIDCEAIVTIIDVDGDDDSAWLPGVVFGRSDRPDRRRTLILVDGTRVAVPATMQLVESVEVLTMPELLAATGDRIGVTGLAVLPTGLTLFCDPLRITGARP